MKKPLDLVGKKFGRLTVLKRVGNTKGGRTQWKCVCSCPNGEKTECVVVGGNLTNGHTQSCGCYRIEKTVKRSTIHGKSYSKLHYLWDSMKQRCYNPKNKRYKIYGAEGKTVCDEWKNNFQAFYDWGIANGFDENAKRGEYTIERIDRTKGYSPQNCRWATDKEQSNNRRSNHLIEYKGKTQTMKQWADEKGIEYKKLWARINKLHWSIEQALETP